MNKTGRSDVASTDKAGRSENFAEAKRPDTNVRPDIHVWVVLHKFAKQKSYKADDGDLKEAKTGRSVRLLFVLQDVQSQYAMDCRTRFSKGSRQQL
jgi:hypothetical protein